jgi:hypothetical protein
MALGFNGQFIRGTHGKIQESPPAIQVVRSQFFGLRGESEIRGEQGGRDLECWIYLHNNYTTANLLSAELIRLAGLVGVNSSLDVSGGPILDTYDDCTFEGFFPLPFDESGNYMLPDVARTLDTNGGWFARGTLRWRQHRV